MARSSGKGAKQAGDPLSGTFRIDNSPFYLMARAYGRYVQDLEGVLKSVGMDLPRWRVLMLLNEKSPSGVRELADRAVMRLSTMTRVVQRMEQEGHVKAGVREWDTRVTDVQITALGVKNVDKVRQAASRIYRIAFAEFTDEETERLNQMLRRIFLNLSGRLE